MERSFSKNEKALKDLNWDKAFGPNGVTTYIFPGCREVVKEDVLGMMDHSYDTETFERSLNALFVALIFDTQEKWCKGYSIF